MVGKGVEKKKRVVKMYGFSAIMVLHSAVWIVWHYMFHA